jgi:hypothetical protein
MKNKGGFVSVIVPVLVILFLIAAVIFLPKVFPGMTVSKIKTVPATKLTSSSTPVPTPSLPPSPPPTPLPTKTASPKPATPVISGPPGAGYSYVTVHTEKGDFKAQILSIDLNSARMITDTANDSDCTSNCPAMSLQSFVNKNGGFAGVNGTYFCPAEPAYSSCGENNSFDFPVWNTRLSHWINGGNLGWNSRSIFYTDGSGANYNENASGFSGSLTAGIVNNPGLIDNGNIQIDDNQSGLSDKQKSVGLKDGIGLIDQKHIIVVIASSVNMQEFAYVFKTLGAKSAMNLDEGGSTALYFNGHYLAGPGRNIPNAIIFAH